MIVKEEILAEIFTQLPPYIDSKSKSFPIKFEWGSETDLTLFLETISGNKYPLIWMVQSQQTDFRNNHYSEAKVRFIIAKNSDQKTSRNPAVYKTDFKDCLNPLLTNFLKALESSGATTIINYGKMTIDRRANYTEANREDKTKTIDYWNAIVVDISLRFEEKANGQPNCINTIKF